MTFAGANVRAAALADGDAPPARDDDGNIIGGNIYLDAGRDLIIASRQNESSSTSKGFNFSVTFQIGPNGPVPKSGSVGGSYGTADRKYTDTPTTIVAANTLDIYTGRTTYLLGAMLNSEAGKLKLDTDTLVFDHFKDRDFELKVSAQIQIDPKRPDASGSLYYRNKQGLTYATIGAGEIVVRADPNASLIALNRDAANVQRTTKNDVINIEIPAVNLKAIVEDITNTANFVSALAADIPEEIRQQGRQASDLFLDAMLAGVAGDKLRAFIGSPEFNRLLMRREGYEIVAALKGKNHPKALEVAFAVARGEQVFFDEATQSYQVRTDCATQALSLSSPCGVPISELKSLSKERVQEFVDSQIDAIVQLTAGNSILGKAGGYIAGTDQFATALYCLSSWALVNGDWGPFKAFAARSEVQPYLVAGETILAFTPLGKILAIKDMIAAVERGDPAAIAMATLGLIGPRVKAPNHHICTNKSYCSTAYTGGPWTKEFESIFEKAGMKLSDPANIVAVWGHKGPHPEAYHKMVFNRLSGAVADKSGAAYRAELQAELARLRTEITTPGTLLNKLVTKTK